MRTAKTLIRLGGCPGLSESSLGAHSLCWFCQHVAQLQITPVCLLRYPSTKLCIGVVFDNIFSRACIKQSFLPKRKFNQSSILTHNGLNNLFPTVQETNHLMEEELLKKMKWMVMYQYLTCDMHFVQRKRCVDF